MAIAHRPATEAAPKPPATEQVQASEPRAAAEMVAEALRAHGVTTVFTLAGGHTLNLLEACVRKGIRVIDVRHEGSATLAAEGYALATGQVGVAVVTAGPGFTNALTGFVDAYLGGVPLLLIGGRTAISRQGRGTVMDTEQLPMLRSHAKWLYSCSHSSELYARTAEALYQARSGRPGPSYLEIPADLLWEGSRIQSPTDQEEGFPAAPPRAGAGTAELEAAAAALQQAQRPLLLLGSGAHWSDAGKVAAELATKAQIPVITTSAARGVVPDSHHWCLGSLVHAGVALTQSDLVVVAGSGFNANLMYGAPPLFSHDQIIIQIDIAAEQLGGNRKPEHALHGDAQAVLSQLLSATKSPAPDRREWLQTARDMALASRSYWDSQIDAHSGKEIHAGALARRVAQVVRHKHGSGVTFVADGGDALAWALGFTDTEQPGHLLTTTTAMGTLGVGIPFAMAAKVARPQEPVILFSGDGAFGLSAMELDSAVRQQLPLVVVVSNNRAWGDIRHVQDHLFGPGHYVASNLGEARYDLLAQSLGGRGELVSDLKELGPALERALDADTVTVIDVHTDRSVLSELLRMIGPLGLM